jgi:hypothetical protein
LREVKNDLPNGVHAYCGPTVLASVTGKRLSVIREMIRAHRWGSAAEAKRLGIRRAGVTGVGISEMRYVLRHFGLDMLRTESYGSKRPTLAAWLKARKEPDNLCIIDVGFPPGGHWAAVKGRKFVDSYTKGVPVWLKDSPHRRKRVRYVWIVTAKD